MVDWVVVNSPKAVVEPETWFIIDTDPVIAGMEAMVVLPVIVTVLITDVDPVTVTLPIIAVLPVIVTTLVMVVTAAMVAIVPPETATYAGLVALKYSLPALSLITLRGMWTVVEPSLNK